MSAKEFEFRPKSRGLINKCTLVDFSCQNYFFPAFVHVRADLQTNKHSELHFSLFLSNSEVNVKRGNYAICHGKWTYNPTWSKFMVIWKLMEANDLNWRSETLKKTFVQVNVCPFWFLFCSSLQFGSGSTRAVTDFFMFSKPICLQRR